MAHAMEDRPTEAHARCSCGEYWVGPDAPHRLHGNDLAVLAFQVEGAPKYGREAHTVRECYREVCADESWTLALREWRHSLHAAHLAPSHGCAPRRVLPAPMPVGHVMFNALPGSATLSRRDNRARSEEAAS